MTSPEAHTLLGAYALDAVDEPDRAEIEAHLAVCSGCAAELVELRAVAGVLGGAVPRTPPASLRGSVLREVAATRQLPPLLTDRRGGPRRPTPLAIVASAAAVVAFVALGVVTGVTVDQHRQLADARAQASALSAVTSAVAAQAAMPMTGGGTLAVVPAGGQVFVDASDLPRLPNGQVYQLWAASARGVRSAGIVGGNAGRVARLLAVSKETTSIKVTVEPAGGSKQPTGEILASARLQR